MARTVEQSEAMPAVQRNAMQLLRGRGFAPRRIVRVESDCILFVGPGDRACTAWLCFTEGQLRLEVEWGFPPEPSAWVLRRLNPPPLTRQAASEDLDDAEDDYLDYDGA